MAVSRDGGVGRAAKQSSQHGEAAHKPRQRWSTRQAGIALLACVTLWMALRYVVDVKVSVAWRLQALQLQNIGNTHCANTCFKANDGVCDEGRQHRDPSRAEAHAAAQAEAGLPQGVSAVHCDLGTDCGDCGPWVGPQADASWEGDQLPVAFLASRNVSVRVRPTSAAAAPANMTVAFTDPALDWDVSKNMQAEGVLEVGVSQVFYTLLARRCGPGGPGGLVADVGANFGWFSMLAARLGCRVVAWEPVPAFRALMSFNLALNHLTRLVDVRQAAVAFPPGSTQRIVVPNRGTWGTAGIGGANIDAVFDDQTQPRQEFEVVSESLDEVLKGEHVDILKVDCEGYEPSVMATAQALLAGGRVDNVVLEYSPGVLERRARWGDMWIHPQMLLDLTKAGFKLLHMNDEFTRVWSTGRAITAAIPTLRAVTPANLAYDLWDARVFRTGWLDADATPNGPFCQAMVELHLDNQGVPERLHPKSFHAMFGHNTNVWASREREVVDRYAGKPVGLFPLHVPINSSWFPPRTVGDGLGGSICAELAESIAADLAADPQKPPKEVEALMTVLVGRRCRCTHQLPCERHAAAADACARAGQTPYVDIVEPPAAA